MKLERVNYNDYVQAMKQRGAYDDAMKLAIGDNFHSFGVLQRELLIYHGLKREHSLVEIGCGSGRLASKLAQFLAGSYVGIDVVPELLQFAKQLSNREDWEFKQATTDFSIPLENESADFICGFSVFTHLLHEQSFRYLRDGLRVLKPGGKFVFSFLEFRMKSHWPVFESTVEAMDGGIHNQFIERGCIEAWSDHLGFGVEGMFDGDKPHFPIAESVSLDDGQLFDAEGHLGQSVCVLTKPK